MLGAQGTIRAYLRPIPCPLHRKILIAYPLQYPIDKNEYLCKKWTYESILLQIVFRSLPHPPPLKLSSYIQFAQF